MLIHLYAIVLVLLAAIPVAMFWQNLPLFRPPQKTFGADAEGSTINSAPTPRGVSVLIPARDEERSIDECLASVTESDYGPLEVIVLDDASADRTAAICRDWIERDARVKLLQNTLLPSGWNGKQHACWRLAQAAQYEWLLFIDADVRLSSDAVSRLVAEASSLDVALLSGFPRQITRSFFERLLIPLMHFILLGYLPLARMRASNGPEFAAGCGQLFLARRSFYMRCDGHRAIAKSRHDGLKLPKVYRKAGLRTDLVDATEIASCRMYRSAIQVFRGLLKNASEGIASPRTILPFTILLAGASVLPLLSLVRSLVYGAPLFDVVAFAIATVLSFVPRFQAAQRFHQSWLGAALHPIGVLVFLLIQWLALFLSALGLRISWRGRG